MIKKNMNVIRTGELMIINVLFPDSSVLVVNDVGFVSELVVNDVGSVSELVVDD